MPFYLCIHSFPLVQNFIRIRSSSLWYKYIETKYWKKLVMPVVLKLFIVHKTWRVSSKCRAPYPRGSDSPDWLRTQKSAFWVSSLPDSDAVGPETTSDEHSFKFILSKTKETDFEETSNWVSIEKMGSIISSWRSNSVNSLCAQYPLTLPFGVLDIPPEDPPSNDENQTWAA